MDYEDVTMAAFALFSLLFFLLFFFPLARRKVFHLIDAASDTAIFGFVCTRRKSFVRQANAEHLPAP